MKAIVMDLRSCFKNTNYYKQKYDDFKKKKFQEIEIQEIVTRIGTNISNEPQLSYHLIDETSVYINDIIDYIKGIALSGSDPKKNFLDVLMKDKVRKRTDMQDGKIILSIVENTITIVTNIFKSPKELVTKFFKKVRFYLN